MNKLVNKSFDFIVVGGGSAGCVLASRLAETGQFSVALIEQGRKDINPWIHMLAIKFSCS